MTLFFDINKLDREACGNVIKFLTILEDHYNKSIKKNAHLSKIKYRPINGTSFLLNPLPLFKIPIDKTYVVQYIKLAGRRDYTLYRLFKTITLDLSYFPDVNLNVIKYNPIIKIVNNKIHFKFEEIYNGTKF